MSKMMVSEEMKNAPAAPSPLRRLLCWEGFLLAVTLAVFIGNAVASPYFLNIWNLSDATFTFTEKAIVALPMAMLIIAREIDLSVASTMALSSTVMGFCVAAGMDTPLLVVIGLGVGLLCGLFNGLLVTRFNLSSIVITIGTMSLYRGITYILLGDQALNHYPESFAWFGQGYVWGALSFEFALFILLAAAFTFLLHKTNFGRRTYAIGNNPTGAWFSGINVKRHNLVAGGRHFVFRGQVDPQLDHLQLAAAAGEGLRVELFVQDPDARRHPLHVAWTNHPAASGGVTMLYFTGVDDGDGFKSAMRMLTDAAFFAARREGVRPGIVEQ